MNPATVESTRQHADRPAHRERPFLAVVRVEVLARERGRLAGEDDEVEPERVQAGEERADQAGRVDQVAVPAAVPERRAR